MGWHAARQRILFAEQQQRGQLHTAHRAIGLDHAERLGKLEIGKLQQRFIATAAALANAATEALELERVEIFPARGRNDLRRRVQQAPVALQRLHRVDIHRRAGRAAIAAQHTAQIDSIAGRNRMALRRNLDDEEMPVIKAHALNGHRNWRTRSARNHRCHLVHICCSTVASAGAADASVVFDADNEPRCARADAVRQAHDGFNQFTIVERHALVALELDDE